MKLENEEYALILIKPDGTEKKLMDKIISVIKDKGFHIVGTNTIQLSKTNVNEFFAAKYNSSLYKRYMTRNAVTAILVKDNHAYSSVMALKKEIRSEYGVQNTNTMENIIHSPEAGNEFEYQLKFFFPELDIDRIGLYADMYVRVPLSRDLSLMHKKLDYIHQSTCRREIFVVDNETYPFIIDSLSEYYSASNVVENYIIGVQYNLRMLEQHCGSLRRPHHRL